MRFALFDVDTQLVQLARDAAQNKKHQLIVFSEPGDHGAELLQLFPTATLEAEWESLLVAGTFDVLVVGCSGREIAAREELLRRAVQEGVPLVAVQPAAESIVMHELAMIQKDTRSLLLPWNQSREHPAAIRTAQLLAGKRISQIVWQRSLRHASRAEVFAQLARDADLLHSLAGPLDRVTALGPAGKDSVSSLAVTFAGPTDALLQWVLQPQNDRSRGRVAISAEGRSYLLESAEAGEPWTLRIDSSLPNDASDHESFAVDGAMLHAIAGALADDSSAPEVTGRWKDACHAAELAEGAQQSLRRGRTIQLHFEEHSEEQTFKGIMAVGGCLVLLFILVVVALSAVVDALGLPMRNSVLWRLWPLYVLAPAVMLLAAQSLWRVFAIRPSPPARRPPASEAND